ncbi:MAG: hypothetical protein F6K40_03155 [Okeania sp. SIO3I5]|uniref:hypothetical protein n=1 Tax=Okeania sp. SIO3I5 TaxID=2607805 RepID=UPI0013B67D92|nr:hypothetical protein [Okeania sp. SIO3I5]NEQ35360.1 hypothetical protein [Okeania sp. SIO3I5]
MKRQLLFFNIQSSQFSCTFIFANQITSSIADTVMKTLMFLPFIFGQQNLETHPPKELKETSSCYQLYMDNYKDKNAEVAEFFLNNKPNVKE